MGFARKSWVGINDTSHIWPNFLVLTLHLSQGRWQCFFHPGTEAQTDATKRTCLCANAQRKQLLYTQKKIIRRQQFFEEIAAGDCNTFVSVTPWETAVIGVSFSDTYGSEGARSVSRQVSSFWRLDGKVTRSRLWRKPEPKLELWRLDGKVTRSRLWLTPQPQLKLWRLDGKVTCSRLWLKFSPKLRLLTS